MDLSIPETWLPVVGFEGRYEISSFGRVRTFCDPSHSHPDSSSRILRLQRNNRGYLRVRLCASDGKRPWRRVHRMVAESFISLSPAPDMTVDHLDFDKENNFVLNLQWLTRIENYRRWREKELQDDPTTAPF